MKSTSFRVFVVFAAAVAAMALFVVLRDSDEGDTISSELATQETVTTAAAPTVPTEPENLIVVRNGEPVDGLAELTFKNGDEITFAVRSDVDEEIHVHGYDVSKPITSGGEVEFSIPADIEGIFEVELEESAVPIAEIRVEP